MGSLITTGVSTSSSVEANARAFDELIGSDALTVAFQPIVDLARARPFAYEVLGRVAPLEGVLADFAGGPAPLLDAAFGCGRLLALDRRWRSRAIDLIASREDDDALYFLNVDPRVVEDPAHAFGFTRDLIARRGLSARRFVLELTEQASHSGPASIEGVLQAYRAQGFDVALDDLGAPLQSLETLVRVRPHYVKVDRALVHAIDRDDMKQHLLRSLVDFAERCGMRLIAAGIETAAELFAVREAGAHLAQGFFLGRPAPCPLPLAASVVTSLETDRSDRIGVTSRGKTRAFEDALLPLVQVVEAIATTSALEPVLEYVTTFTADLLGVERATIRLLDESRTRLLVAARTGPSVHPTSNVDFAVGEGLVGWVVENKRPLMTSHASRDPRFAAKPGMVAFESFLGVPLLDEEGCIGVLATSEQVPAAFDLDHERRLRLVAAIVSPRLQLARLHRLLVTDPLTCVWNRRALEELLHREQADVTIPLSIVAVDIDRFKSINDHLGHAVGDEVLRKVARALSSAVRESDHVVRVGGEEFILILRGATTLQATAIAERARIAVRTCDALADTTVTVSAGVAERRPNESRESLFARADVALYRAKARGRDRVEIETAA